MSRIAGRQLQAIREHWFTLHPLCVRCKLQGRVALAVELDHIVALMNGGADFDEDGGQNRQGLCVPCHVLKTAADKGGKVGGCDADGRPIDPNHPWNRKDRKP